MRSVVMRMLPPAWRPAANFHYYRLRGLLEPEMGHLCRSLGPGHRAIDVGANEGVFFHAFARTGAFVEAFEPQPQFAAVLREYATGRPSLRVHPIALGSADGSGMLQVPVREGRAVAGHASLVGTEGQRISYEVPVRTLDSFAFEQVRAIKVDVEGHELEVLRGARETLERWHPLLLVEIEQRHQRLPLAEAFAEITALGYSGQFLHPSRGLLSISEFRPAEHQSLVNADRLGALYINNFLFTRPAVR